MQTRDRMYCQTIRTVGDISRDDRGRIATCSLLTVTDRNYSVDVISIAGDCQQFFLPSPPNFN